MVGVWFGVETAYRKSLIAKNESSRGGALKAKGSRLAAATAVNTAERPVGDVWGRAPAACPLFPGAWVNADQIPL
ncbi:hypothetical protein SAMN02745898_10986 [Streptomyces sp. 136MFCol5.1]|nr:hypothetical protein SAMN02745898_10986 [Streptomyces sp. 136MFCol5.1]SFT27979.1 hypothetical protein SAMN04487982_11362 [Streptomyces sp. ok210]